MRKTVHYATDERTHSERAGFDDVSWMWTTTSNNFVKFVRRKHLIAANK